MRILTLIGIIGLLVGCQEPVLDYTGIPGTWQLVNSNVREAADPIELILSSDNRFYFSHAGREGTGPYFVNPQTWELSFVWDGLQMKAQIVQGKEEHLLLHTKNGPQKLIKTDTSSVITFEPKQWAKTKGFRSADFYGRWVWTELKGGETKDQQFFAKDRPLYYHYFRAEDENILVVEYAEKEKEMASFRTDGRVLYQRYLSFKPREDIFHVLGMDSQSMLAKHTRNKGEYTFVREGVYEEGRLPDSVSHLYENAMSFAIKMNEKGFDMAAMEQLSPGFGQSAVTQQVSSEAKTEYRRLHDLVTNDLAGWQKRLDASQYVAKVKEKMHKELEQLAQYETLEKFYEGSGYSEETIRDYLAGMRFHLSNIENQYKTTRGE